MGLNKEPQFNKRSIPVNQTETKQFQELYQLRLRLLKLQGESGDCDLFAKISWI